MLDYTKAALQKIADDFKRLVYFFNVVTQIAYMAYLTYAIFAGMGILWINITLAAIAMGYFVFFMIVTQGKALYVKQNLHVVVQRIFKISKLLLKFFTIGVMLYGIYNTTQNVTPFGVILSAMMIVGWLLQLIFEVIGSILTSRFQLLVAAIEADKEELSKPVKAVGNFFKKLTGKEVEPEKEKEKSKSRIWLDKKVEENRAKRREEKLQEKTARRQARKDARNTVFFTEEEKVYESTPPRIEVFEEPPLLTSSTMSKKELKAAKKAEKKARKEK